METAPIYCQTMITHQTRQLAANGPRVFPLGLGCMCMSDLYGPADETESIATIHAALDAGVTVPDTGDYSAATTSSSSAAPCAIAARRQSSRSSSAPCAVRMGAGSAWIRGQSP
jgi:predicted aldo/keto reductase-like oxidoreductase